MRHFWSVFPLADWRSVIWVSYRHTYTINLMNFSLRQMNYSPPLNGETSITPILTCGFGGGFCYIQNYSTLRLIIFLKVVTEKFLFKYSQIPVKIIKNSLKICWEDLKNISKIVLKLNFCKWKIVSSKIYREEPV